MSLGGGGHKNAAGFKMTGNLEFVREQLLARLAPLLEHRHGA
jgi:nanoRNase/pAp phosphatase (c-di-AMP/oligoRNAs hydrolase)